MSEPDDTNPTDDVFGASRPMFDAASGPAFLQEAGAAMDPARFAEALRTMSERSVEQSRDAYGRMKLAADDASRALESTLENAHTGSLSFSKQMVDAMRANAEMGFAHLERLASVKSVAELIELQSSYVRRQAELAGDQAKAMQALSQTVAKEVLKPGREAVDRTTGRDPA